MMMSMQPRCTNQGVSVQPGHHLHLMKLRTGHCWPGMYNSSPLRPCRPPSLLLPDPIPTLHPRHFPLVPQSLGILAAQSEFFVRLCLSCTMPFHVHFQTTVNLVP